MIPTDLAVAGVIGALLLGACAGFALALVTSTPWPGVVIHFTQAQEAPMPVSKGVSDALTDVTKAAQVAIDGAYKSGFADGQSAFTAEAEQDDSDTAAAVEDAATAIGSLAPTKPAPNSSGS